MDTMETDQIINFLERLDFLDCIGSIREKVLLSTGLIRVELALLRIFLFIDTSSGLLNFSHFLVKNQINQSPFLNQGRDASLFPVPDFIRDYKLVRSMSGFRSLFQTSLEPNDKLNVLIFYKNVHWIIVESD